MILWRVRSPPFARMAVGITNRMYGKEATHLGIVENEAERSRDRFERTESTCGVSHPTEQFGRGRRSTLGVGFFLIHGDARFEGLCRANSFWPMFRKSGGVYVFQKNDQRRRRKQPCLRTIGGWRATDSPKFSTVTSVHPDLNT